MKENVILDFSRKFNLYAIIKKINQFNFEVIDFFCGQYLIMVIQCK
jgi:hypothetical protein